MRKIARALLLLGLLAGLPATRTVEAQPANEGGQPPQSNPFALPAGQPSSAGLPGSLASATDSVELELSGELDLERGSRRGMLRITGKLAADWHVYALDQQGGPGPGRLTVGPAERVKVLEPFQPDRQPEQRKVEYFDEPLREHYGRVTWSAPIELAEGVTAGDADLEVVFEGQICNDAVGCKPIFGQRVPIRYAGVSGQGEPGVSLEVGDQAEAASPATEGSASGDFRARGARAALVGQVRPSTVQPGGSLELNLAVACDPSWHVYAYAPRDPNETAKPTLVALDLPPGWSRTEPRASSEPVTKALLENEPPVRYHEGPVSWSLEVRVPADAAAGPYVLRGILGYQTCTETGCDRPRAAAFTAEVQVGEANGAVRALAFTEASYAKASQWVESAAALAASPAAPATSIAEEHADAEPQVEAAATAPSATAAAAAQGDGQYSYATLLGLAFLGGLILNVMPCVFPVIGLKIMAFVQQSGEKRSQVFLLNVWYALGMLAVFFVLATLAVAMNLGWGQQFNNQTFAITMAAIVFAMGLSFLGVWEIPIPGFVGSSAAHSLGEREGPAGAWFKGVITTLLATPCSGPGLAVALGYAQNKPPTVVYPLFLMVGLGMASPYLLLGAFPQLLRFLPRPGQWMETFKQVMGFVLMATVVYLLSFIDWVHVLPTVTLLVGLGYACWVVGRISLSASSQQRLRTWLWAAAIAGLFGLYAFGGKIQLAGRNLYGLKGTMEHRLERDIEALVAQREQAAGPLLGQGGENADPLLAPEATEHTDEIRWHAYTEDRLQRLRSAQRTVIIDFTADWCLTCKTLEANVLDTAEVRRVLRENGVLALIADWSNDSPEVGQKLESLGSKQVPVLAIYPAGSADPPIVLQGFYDKATLLQALEQAGPSRQLTRAEDSLSAASG